MRKYILSFLVIAASGAYVWHVKATGDTLNTFPGAALSASSQADGGPVLSLPTHLSVLNGPGAAPPPVLAPDNNAPALPPRQTPSAVAAEPPKPPAIVAQNAPDLAPALPDPQTPPAASTSTAVTVPMPILRPAYPPAAAATTDATTTASVTPPPPPPLPKGQYRDGAYSGPTINAYYGLVKVRAVVRNGKVVSVDVLRYPNERRTSARINRYALPALRREALRAQNANVNIVSGATLTSMAYRRSLDRALADART